VIVLFSEAAFAQSFGFPMGATRKLSPEEAEQERIIDQNYRDAASKIPEKKPSSTDPWGNVRSNSAPAKPSTSKQQPR
jgi:hypothetical protein